MNSKAIAILGMHRSGTSLIARAINLMGAYLGEEEDLMKPSPHNPEGYWEREDITNLNNSILEHFSLFWHTPVPLPEGWVKKAEGFKEKIQKLVNEHFKDKPLWAWKDPRTTILFPLWKTALEEMGINLSVVFVVRNPLDVARSLKKRDGFSIDKGFGIWFNYNLCGLCFLDGVPAVVVSYDRFLGNWKEELARLNSLLHIGAEDAESLYDRVKGAIRPDLRHSASTLEELKRLNPPYAVVELYELVEELSKKKEPLRDIADNQVFKKLKREFFAYARFYREDMKKSFGLQDRLHDVEARLNAVLNSRSWKITEPLRKILDILRK